MKLGHFGLAMVDIKALMSGKGYIMQICLCK
jgi:hypothetical protein